MKTRKLSEVRAEVEKIVDKKGLGIDPGIKDLVIGLRKFGVETEASCEGHRNWGEPFPWVDIPFKDVKKTSLLLNRWFAKRWYAQRKKHDWIFNPYGDRWFRLEPYSKGNLEKMQASAKELGKFLQRIKRI